MEFSRIGEHTIKCVISEEEIYDLGYTMDEIMSNGERTQEFMNQIFDMAEEEFGIDFNMGIKTVRADFLADHTLSLTFSEHPATEGMMEHLKDIVNGLINSLPPEAVKQSTEKNTKKQIKKQDMVSVVMFIFEKFDVAVRFAKIIRGLPSAASQFFKFEGEYFMSMDLSSYDEHELEKMSVIADEYADDIIAGADKRAFLMEHAQTILGDNAIESLAQL